MALISTISIAEMTSPEVEDAVRSGVTTVVVVAGSTEQHGPHLPTASDTIQGIGVGGAFARRIGALLAPVIPIGCSDHHLGFAGTVSIRPELLVAIVREYCASLLKSGFRRVIILSSHGGNFGPLKDAEDAFRAEFEPAGLEIVALCDIEPYVEALMGPSQRAGLNPPPLPHGDVSETSLMLALSPDLVHLERGEPGHTGPVPLEKLLNEGLRAVTANGILGDPRGAREDVGRESLAALVDMLERTLSARSGASAAAIGDAK